MNRLISLLAGLLLAGAIALGQTTSASLSGHILDQSGASIPAAVVTVMNAETAASRESKSGENGAYLVPLLEPGSYRVTVKKDGFRPVSRSGIVLQVNQAARIDFHLEVGELTQAIEVQAGAPLIEQDTSSLGGVIENRRITELPLNGRNAMSLIQLTAGVTPQAGINAGFVEGSGFLVSNVSISGGRGSLNALLLDGATNAAPTREEIAASPSVDAVEEFKVFTNGAPAEFGRTTGGVVTMVTKSGTNSLRGSLYEFVRNDKFDARNAFANTRPPFRYNQPGGSVGGPVYLPKVYDGRNRTFFFFAYEAYRHITYGPQFFTMPTAAQRNGDFSTTVLANGSLIPIYDPETTTANPSGTGFVRTPFPGNRIPTSRFDKIATQLLRDLPAPNSAPTNALTNLNNYFYQSRTNTKNDQWMGRFDHSLSANHRLTYRLVYNQNIAGKESPFGNYLTNSDTNDIATRNNSQQVASWTWSVTPSVFSDLRAGYVRTPIDRAPRHGPADVERLGYPAIIPRIYVPQHAIQDFTDIGGGTITDGGVHTISLNESIMMVKGKHTVKFGGEVWGIRNNRFQFSGLSGVFRFNRDLTNNPQAPTNSGYGVATFLLGAVNAGQLNTGAKRYERARYFAGFVQDDWRLSRRLTLNLGLRYDFETNPYDRYDQRSNFNFTKINPVTKLPGVLEYSGVDYDRSPVANDYNNFGPRFGFAWSVDGANKTVVRGSYGIYYQGNFEMFESNLGWSSSTPFNDPSIGPRPTFYLAQGPKTIIAPPGNTLGPRGFLANSVEGRQPFDRVGYIQQWSLSVQRLLPLGWLVETAYSANKGTSLGVGPETWNANAFDPKYLALGLDLQTQVANPLASLGVFGATVARSQLFRPYPAYQGVTVRAPHAGSSIYHGLHMTARKPLAQGHSVILSYTFGKVIDDSVPTVSNGFAGSNTGTPGFQNPYDRRAERSISPTDVSQRLVASYILELPFGRGRRWLTSGLLERVAGGWQMTGILTAATGLPLLIRGAQNNAADRPNSTGRSARLDPSERTVRRWFDTTAFLPPALYTYGNVGRVLPDVRGPGVFQLDAGLQKYFVIKESLRLQLRGEAFNLTNKVNLGLPNTSFVSTAFGTINATATPARVIQIGAKLIF